MGRQLKSAHGNFFASLGQLMGARALLVVLQFLSLPLLSRLLSIEDFAIVGLGLAVILFANTFSDAGLGRSLVRTQHYNPTEWDTVFWFLATLGLLLAGLVVLVAPLYSRAMDQPTLLPVVIVLASVPFMQALTAVHQAAIERDYRFDVMSGVIGFSGLAGVIVALSLAALGFGYWALVLQQVALAFVRLVGLLWLSPVRPKFRFHAPLLRPHLKFGVNTLAFSGVLTLQSQIPLLAFNQVFGTVAVSLWSMTERIFRFPQQAMLGPLSQVTMVSMARQWRDGTGQEQVSTSYRAAIRLLMTLTFPGLVVLALNGRPIFVWLLSAPWGDVAVIFALALPGLMIDMITSVGARVFMVADRTDLRLRMAVERFAIGVPLFLAALPFGLTTAILVRSLFMVAYLPRYVSYLNRCVPLRTYDVISPALMPLCIGAVVGGLCWWLGDLHPLALIACGVLASVCAALVSYRALHTDIGWLRQSALVTA